MPTCPACFGKAQHDLRDEDCVLAEHMDDATLREAKRDEFWMTVQPCGECDCTGVVSEARLYELREQAARLVAAATKELERREAAGIQYQPDELTRILDQLS